MYKIGEFSVLAKTTIKTLRYYETEQLLSPCFVDPETGYRYYEASQLIPLSKIVSLRQIGCSIKQIKKYLAVNNFDEILLNEKKQVENELIFVKEKLSKINYLLKEKEMKYEVTIKQLPSHIIYYKEGIIKNIADITSFILQSGEECLQANPNLKCEKPDYCYVNYLDGEYKEKNLKVRYAQAVEKMGKETNTIKFDKLQPVKAICIYHKGSYSNLREAYSFIMTYIKENNYEIIDFPRECYIDGMWNKDNEEDWLTEIQVPVK